MMNLVLTKEIKDDDGFCKQYDFCGYVVFHKGTKLPSGKMYEMIQVQKKDYYSYLPEIYARTNHDWETVDFEIQTTSYGTLNVDEILKLTKCMNEAVEAVKILKDEFCK